MSPERLQHHPETLNINAINAALFRVELNWQSIQQELIRQNVGEKDIPFTQELRGRMVTAYEYINSLLLQRIKPFSIESFPHMIELNNIVHYGYDEQQRREHESAIEQTSIQFYDRIDPVKRWVQKHEEKKDEPLKVSSEIYAAVIGHPQVFIGGNHRSASLLVSWYNMYNRLPPFVLTPENAVAYFVPSSELKKLPKWRGNRKLPKFKKRFLEFLETHIKAEYVDNSEYLL